MSEYVLDAKGLNCPLPILKTKKMIKDVPHGEILTVYATDPGSVADMAAFCNQTGNELESGQEGDVFVFKIRHTAG
jgi:tRNA 2-thiouridine synthesizing protein A